MNIVAPHDSEPAPLVTPPSDPYREAWRRDRRRALSVLRDAARRAWHDAEIANAAARRVQRALEDAEVEAHGVPSRYRTGAALSWLVGIWLRDHGTEAELAEAVGRRREDWMRRDYVERCLRQLARAGWIVRNGDGWRPNRRNALLAALVRGAFR